MRFIIAMSVIAVCVTAGLGYPGAAVAMEQLLAADGWIRMESDAYDWSVYDADGDGQAEVCFARGSGAQQTFHGMKLDGTTVCVLTLSKNSVCPACGPDWQWFFLSFGDVDASAGPEAVLTWYDYSTNRQGVCVVRAQTGALLANFDGASAEAVLDLDANGSKEVIVEYETPLRRFEVWGYVPQPEGVQGSLPPASAAAMRVRGVPNPASDGILLVLQMDREAEAHVRIVDIAGRVVRDLGSHRMGPGESQLAWDGNDDQAQRVSDGVYTVVVTEGSRRASSTVVRLD
jgi:hypothetical protein